MDSETQVITVVSGLPRSGTSVMMQMIAAGGMPVLTDGERKPDEDNPRGYYEYEAVKQIRQDASWLPLAQGQAVKMVHLLLKELPATYNYRVILMKRHIEEVLSSQKVMLERNEKTGAAIAAEQLGKIFTAQMQDVESWLRVQPNFRLLIVSYNDLIASPLREAEGIAAFCGGLNAAAMAAAVSVNLHRQRAASPVTA